MGERGPRPPSMAEEEARAVQTQAVRGDHKKVQMRVFMEDQQRLLRQNEDLTGAVRQLTDQMAVLVQTLGEQKAQKEVKTAQKDEIVQQKAGKTDMKIEHFEKMRQALLRMSPEEEAPRRPLRPYQEVIPKLPYYAGYKDTLPEVELSVKVTKLSEVSTATLKFEVDLILALDWFDPCLPWRENGKEWSEGHLAQLDWEEDWFNPELEMDNAVEVECLTEGDELLPRVSKYECDRFGERKNGSCQGADGGPEGCWLTKTLRFRGVLAMERADLLCFPFDIQILPVRFKAKRWKARKGGPRDLYSFTSGMQRRGEKTYKNASRAFKGDGHVAAPTADGMQEFDFFGICGYPKLELSKKFDVYEVALVVKRPIGTLCADIIITNVLVWIACASFYDIASPDLSARMSISLTIMLTLASYMSDRPPAIENLPSLTIHDWNEIAQWGLLILISIQNIFAVFLCGAEGQVLSGAGEAPSAMIGFFDEGVPWHCEKGFCHSRQLDCYSMLVVFGLQALIALYNIWWTQRHRFQGCRELAGVREEGLLGRRLSSEGRRESEVERIDEFGKLLRRSSTKALDAEHHREGSFARVQPAALK